MVVAYSVAFLLCGFRDSETVLVYAVTAQYLRHVLGQNSASGTTHMACETNLPTASSDDGATGNHESSARFAVQNLSFPGSMQSSGISLEIPVGFCCCYCCCCCLSCACCLVRFLRCSKGKTEDSVSAACCHRLLMLLPMLLTLWSPRTEESRASCGVELKPESACESGT